MNKKILIKKRTENQVISSIKTVTKVIISAMLKKVKKQEKLKTFCYNNRAQKHLLTYRYFL